MMLSDLIPISLVRLPRNKCGHCGRRRILFTLTVYGEVRGVALCATCAGGGVFRQTTGRE